MEVSDDILKEILDSIMLVERGYDVDGMNLIVSQLPELNYEYTLACCGQNDSVILGSDYPVVLWRSAPYRWNAKRASWATIICNVEESVLKFNVNGDSWESPRRSTNVEADLNSQRIVHCTGCLIGWSPIDVITYIAYVLIWP